MGVLMVTHNVAEALEIADRLLLVSGRPASLLGTIALDRPRGQRDRGLGGGEPSVPRRAIPRRHRKLIRPGSDGARASIRRCPHFSQSLMRRDRASDGQAPGLRERLDPAIARHRTDEAG